MNIPEIPIPIAHVSAYFPKTLIIPKLIIFDVDGVLTDGIKIYNMNGEAIAKRFNDKDFTAMKRFKAAGIKICWLSGDAGINKIIAERRHIDFYYSRSDDGRMNKLDWIEKLFNIYDCNEDNTFYVGDDYFDVDIIEKLKYTFCPQNSPLIVKENAYEVLPVDNGYGVAYYLYDYLKKHTSLQDAERSVIDDLDKRETR